MLELQSQPTLEASQPLSGNEICEAVLGRQLGYSKGIGWGPWKKFRNIADNSSSTSYEREMHTREVIELEARIEEVTELHERAIQINYRKHKENADR